MRYLPLKHYFPTAKGIVKNMLYREAVYPFYASFKITSRCHFSCRFCNVKNHAAPDLSTENIKKVLDNLSRSSVLMTSFEGGEPLLRKDIEELLKYAAKSAFYLLFTTSDKNLFNYDLEKYSRYIDFFHISIDEEHNNLDMFDMLGRLQKLPAQVSVQTVVTSESIGSLDDKVRLCHESGACIVIIPAAKMDDADDCFPDMIKLEKKVGVLRRAYPGIIHTPQGFFSAYRKGACSTASIVIASDGSLYYPCHILGTKGPDLTKADLNEWVVSKQAKELRKTASQCTRNCGWYQYYAISSYTSPVSVFNSLKPMLFQKKSLS